MEGKCSGRKECKAPKSWLSGKRDQVCPTMHPEVKFISSRNPLIKFNIDFEGDTSIGKNLVCEFQSKSISPSELPNPVEKTDSEFNGNSISCRVPWRTTRAGQPVKFEPLDGNNDLVNVTLLYRPDPNQLDSDVVITSSSVHVFNPRIVDPSQSCISCLSNENWRPVWNVESKECQDEDEQPGSKLIRNKSKCPTTQTDNQRYPVDREFIAQIRQKNIDQLESLYGSSGDMSCVFYSNNGTEIIKVNAAYSNVGSGSSGFDRIDCEKIKIPREFVSVLNFEFAVNVRLRLSTDDKQRFYEFDALDSSITLFNCEQGDGNSHCSSCRSREGCQFIEIENGDGQTKCSSEGQGKRECPAPKINSIFPLSGSVDATVQVNISGTDLGLVGPDTKKTDSPLVFIGTNGDEEHKLCNLVNRTADWIVCEMPKQKKEISVNLTVNYRGKTSEVTDRTQFDYKRPTIESVTPSYGVTSGGTKLTVIGSNLNISANQIVQLGSRKCLDHQVSENSITCRTPPSGMNIDSQKSFPVSVFFDTKEYKYSGPFEYIADPEIVGMKICKQCSGPFDGIESLNEIGLFCSGGTSILIKVFSYFDLSKEPRIVPEIYFAGNRDGGRKCLPDLEYDENRKQESKSMVETRGPSPNNNFYYKCTTPKSDATVCSDATLRRRRRNTPVEELRIRIDGFEKGLVKAKIFRVPIPTSVGIEEFAPNKIGDIYLKFKSKEARGAFTVDDLDLFIIDDKEAKLEDKPKISTHHICEDKYCDVFDSNGDAEREQFDDYHLVLALKVEMPKVLPKNSIGVLTYEMKYSFGEFESPTAMEIEATGMSIQTASLIGLTVIILAIAVGAVIWILWTKMKQYQGKQKGLEKQLASIEERVTMVARRAYHELNLDISDLANDVKSGNLDIPLHTFSYYMNSVLFPRQNREEIALSPTKMAEMNRLMKLIRNPNFICIAMETIQDIPGLSPRERSKLGSLLTSILANDPEYLTKITFKLTGSFLKKQAEGRSPKLAFRWAESVAEKLLANWIHLSLFKAIQGDSGRSLWLLLLAIKQQGWKGPIDAVRGHARFTLTETRLLREDPEYKQLKLSVIQPGVTDASDPNNYIFVTVLDCDTIIQVKDKCCDAIYRNKKFSEWPQ